MYKSLITTLILTSAVASPVMANELSEQNLVKRSLTLKSGEVQLGAALGYGEVRNGSDDDYIIGLDAAYGFTDNFTLSATEARYRWLARPDDDVGLEITTGAGLKGMLETGNENVFGYGLDVAGKYVISEDVAVTFATEYVFWNERGDDNSEEYRYSVGALYQPVDKVTLMAGYTFSDFHGFAENNAYALEAGVNYAFNKQTDFGVGFRYSDFDPVANGFDADSAYQRVYGAYVSYRF